jgi:hypothetical protein
MEDLLQWYFAAQTQSNPAVSETRDVFEARSQKIFPALLKHGFNISDASLIYSMIGEIGNNSFDHNLGLWVGQPGCYFAFEVDQAEVTIGLADHGRGIFSSLKRVVPALASEQEAIETAFEKVISGRAPEQRGNGLKFVRQIINGNSSRALVSRSGSGIITLGGNDTFIKEMISDVTYPKPPAGMLTLIRWVQS